ncbi:MAG: pyrroloquinoline quinone biosynthesis peptide chaperone PqqD [Candidatus Eutrophobiaceae bacterium]
MKFSSEHIPEIASTFRLQWETVQNCFVILYPEGMVKLSQSAGEIMQRIDGSTTVEDIVRSLEKHFSTNGIEDDIHAFLEHAHDNGWIKNKS